MSVQFILGRSGTGKTSYCIRAIVKALLDPAASEPLMLLVPEQATYQAERAILSNPGVTGYTRLNVLSFNRLQFLLLGKNTAKPDISRLGRHMIVHRILRDNSHRLKLFASLTDRPGLARQIAETVSELHQYGKAPADIEQLLIELRKEQSNNLTAIKFADVGLILDQYLKFIEGRFVDPDVQLNLARRAIEQAAFIKGARLWVDGFSSFTTSELSILTELLKAVPKAQIALCMDPSNVDLESPAPEKIDPGGLFSPTEQTYTQLVEIVRKCKLDLAEPIVLKKPIRFSRSTTLAQIEKNVFVLESAKLRHAKDIHIVAASNRRREVQFVARQIRRLVKDKSLRYRDIAVIASDINDYQHYLRAYFEDYRIPVFIDSSKLLNQHPLVHVILSALKIVSGNFSHSDIFTYLKSGFVAVEPFDIDLLENYCLAYGVRGEDWLEQQQWHFAGKDDRQFDEQYINQVREKSSRVLFELRERLCPSGSTSHTIGPTDFVKAVFDFLEALGVRPTIGRWIEEATQVGDYATVDEHRQLYAKVVDVLDQLVEVFDGILMSCQDYLAVLNSAFSQLKLGLIPPKLDQVLVGSIERSRHPDLKAVFLIGATQKQFPVPVGSNSILTDTDRLAAQSAGFHLASTSSQKLAERQYLAYIAFTRPSEFLYITYPVADDKGRPIARSQFIADLESLFDDLEVEFITSEPLGLTDIYCENELADLLCRGLGKDNLGHDKAGNEELTSLFAEIRSDKQLCKISSLVNSAIKYENRAELHQSTVKELFGNELASSATRLSSFAACPYQYFAKYTLQLKERQEFKLEPLDLGNFYHIVLDALVKKIKRQDKDFATIDDECLLHLLRETMAQIVQQDPFISKFVRHRRFNKFLIDMAGERLEECTLAIAQMIRAGAFRPIKSELAFGQIADASEKIGQYRVPLSDGRWLNLRGKIDRLDVADINGEKAAVVFDYKKSANSASFSWSKFYNGLDIQLPVYMLAVRDADGSPVTQVAGAFYIPIEVNPKKVAINKALQEKETFDYRAKGLFNGEFAAALDGTTDAGTSKFYNFHIKDGQPYGYYGSRGALRPEDFEKVLQFAEKKIIELAEGILSGQIAVRPCRLGTELPCSRCKYKPLCRFDWQINDYNFLQTASKAKTLEETGDAD